ncbi:accessory gene regulator B family protein [Enterococcus caccae]|uniref:accessory gene regulator B family protein n=1 Tax=Enterococcus caccae TaxID=317735 RepID=UPI0003A13B8C|nr:accessory gene regulator B family protein [Enterococcus caccae]
MEVKQVINKSMCLTERTAIFLVERLNVDAETDKIKYLKCKLALEIILINFSKLSIIYVLSFMLGITKAVLVFHIAFLYIRKYAYGAHSNSSLKCTIISLILFVGIPFYLVNFVLIPKEILLIVLLINSSLIYKFAPAATKKNPISDLKKKRELRRKALVANSVMMLLLIINVIPLGILNLVIFGSFFSCLTLSPYVYAVIE